MKAAFTVVVALIASGCGVPSESRWSIVPDQRSGVWRIDTRTGALEHCTLGDDYVPIRQDRRVMEPVDQVRCWSAPQAVATE